MAIINTSDEQSLSILGKNFYWSIFILILVHTSGAIGMAFYDTSFFASMTPFNLLLVFILLIWNERQRDKELFYAFLIAFITGFAVELIGVNTQRLFGHYSYGNVLGIKFSGVPLLIGVNWFIIVYSNFLLAGLLLKNTFLKRYFIEGKAIFGFTQSIFTALFAVVFDWLMEPVALKLDFWFWENSIVPFYNYFCWFVFSFLISFLFFYLKLRRHNLFAISMIFVQVIFFIFLRIFLK